MKSRTFLVILTVLFLACVLATDNKLKSSKTETNSKNLKTDTNLGEAKASAFFGTKTVTFDCCCFGKNSGTMSYNKSWWSCNNSGCKEGTINNGCTKSTYTDSCMFC